MLAELDPLIHSQLRLAIMSILLSDIREDLSQKNSSLSWHSLC